MGTIYNLASRQERARCQKALLTLSCVVDYFNNICYSYCNEWDMKFNVKKSNVMVVGKNDNTILMPSMQLGTENLTWVKEIKYLGVVMHSKNGLRVNTNYNCRKSLCSSFSILQKCGRLSEPVLCKIILTKCLPILTYGLECFNLLNSQRQQITMAFNTVIRKIFKLSKHTSVRHVIHYIGSKPCKILIDERRCLLISLCLTSCYASVKNIALLYILSDDFNFLCVNYDICYLYNQHEIRQSFCKYMDVYVTLS